MPAFAVNVPGVAAVAAVPAVTVKLAVPLLVSVTVGGENVTPVTAGGVTTTDPVYPVVIGTLMPKVVWPLGARVSEDALGVSVPKGASTLRNSVAETAVPPVGVAVTVTCNGPGVAVVVVRLSVATPEAFSVPNVPETPVPVKESAAGPLNPAGSGSEPSVTCVVALPAVPPPAKIANGKPAAGPPPVTAKVICETLRVKNPV